jgi:hypothetical protein
MLIEGLNSASARTLMLAMLAAEIEIRVSVVSRLARPGTLRHGAQPPAA